MASQPRVNDQVTERFRDFSLDFRTFLSQHPGELPGSLGGFIEALTSTRSPSRLCFAATSTQRPSRPVQFPEVKALPSKVGACLSEICRGLEPFLAIRSRRSGQKSSEKCELLSDQAYCNGWMQNCNFVNVSSFSQTPSQAKCEHCEATSALLDGPVVRRFSALQGWTGISRRAVCLCCIQCHSLSSERELQRNIAWRLK